MDVRAILPAHQPGMIVCPPDSLAIRGQHRGDVCAGEIRPRVGDGVVDFATLALPGSRVGASDGEDAPVGKGGRGLVATCDSHVGTPGERVVGRVVEAGHLSVGAARDEDASVLEHAEPGAKHVVLCV